MLKNPKGSPFYIFRHYETVKNSHFFDILQQNGCLKYENGPPF